MTVVNRQGHSFANQHKDLQVTFTCPDQFQILISEYPTNYTAADLINLQADPDPTDPSKVCSPPAANKLTDSDEIVKIREQSPFDNNFEWEAMRRARTRAKTLKDKTW